MRKARRESIWSFLSLSQLNIFVLHSSFSWVNVLQSSRSTAPSSFCCSGVGQPMGLQQTTLSSLNPCQLPKTYRGKSTRTPYNGQRMNLLRRCYSWSNYWDTLKVGGAWGGRIVRERDKVKEASSLASASAFLCLFTFLYSLRLQSLCVQLRRQGLPMCSLCVPCVFLSLKQWFRAGRMDIGMLRLSQFVTGDSKPLNFLQYILLPNKDWIFVSVHRMKQFSSYLVWCGPYRKLYLLHICS